MRGFEGRTRILDDAGWVITPLNRPVSLPGFILSASEHLCCYCEHLLRARWRPSPPPAYADINPPTRRLPRDCKGQRQHIPQSSGSSTVGGHGGGGGSGVGSQGLGAGAASRRPQSLDSALLQWSWCRLLDTGLL